MVAKQGFLNPGGEERTVDTATAVAISPTDVAFAALPAAVQTAAAALSANADWRLGTFPTVGNATDQFWFSRAGGDVAIS